MPRRKSWKEKKHTLKECRAYNVGYALGRSGYTGDALTTMYDEASGTVGRTSKEVLSSLKGFNRGASQLDKAKAKTKR